MLNKKTILITGGAGFIGSHLCRKLINVNQIICIDNLVTGRIENIKDLLLNPDFHFINYSIEKPLHVIQDLPKIEITVNLACPASPIDYQKLPLETLMVSSVGTKNMLDLALKDKAKFLHASTSEVYGNPLKHPQNEKYFGNVNCYGPRSCYDEGKRFAESLMWVYRKKFNLETKVVRIFNTYGPFMRKNDGRVISNFIVQALSGKPLTIYGNGHQTRSFCYISDMITGLIKMMESKEEGPINLGNPTEFTILELAKKVIKLTNSKLRIIHKALPGDDPTQRKPDISLAKEKLGWSPHISLDEGLKETIEWFREIIKCK